MQLVRLLDYAPGIVIDLRYATINNIAGAVLYASDKALLDITAATALGCAAKDFEQLGLSVVVWDAYRPPEVQEKLRRIHGDEKYVRSESLHCKGIAVDITLADAAGKLLDMGTDFDDFTPRAHLNAAGLNPAQTGNRSILATVMRTHGFAQWPYEWWHFDYLSLL